MQRLTEKRRVVVTDPPVLDAVTVYTIKYTTVLKVPPIAPVVSLSVRPDGRDGSTDQDVTSPPEMDGETGERVLCCVNEVLYNPAYDNEDGATAFTTIVKTADLSNVSLPDIRVALNAYTALLEIAEGVPVSAPVVVFRVKPAGRDTDEAFTMLHESHDRDISTADIATSTVREMDEDERVRVGHTGITEKETVVLVDPPVFVAVTV